MVKRIFSSGLIVVMISVLTVALGIAGENVKVGIVCEITGGGASSGGNWERGVLMAVEDINEAGGILGRQLETFTLDTKSEAPVSVAAMKKAIERDPFVVFGTVWSGSTIVNMRILQEAGIPQFTGSEALPITQQGNPNIFRTSHNAALSMRKMIQWITDVLKVKKLAIFYSNNTWGMAYHDALLKLLKTKGKGVKIASDIAIEVGQMDFTGELLRAKASGADTFFLALLEEECGRMLPQMKETGLDKLVRRIGSINLLAADTIRLAGEAANGGQGQVDFTPVAKQVKPLAGRYEKKYREMATHNFFKGYLAVHVVKAAVEQIGVFDQQKVRDTIHNHTFCVKDHPRILMDVYYDDKGDIDRGSFLVQTVDQKHVVTGILPPLHPERFKTCE